MQNNLIIIQARMTSKRFPGKVLAKVNEVNLLQLQIERILKVRTPCEIIIATTTNLTDQPIVNFCNQKSIKYFRGSENDVLERFFQCSNLYDYDTIIRLTADCPLVNPKTIDNLLAKFKSGNFDYASNTAPWNSSSYPNGSDVEIFSKSALDKISALNLSKEDREHVTFHFWKNPHLFKTLQIHLAENLSKFRYTVDYPQDLVVVGYLFEYLQSKNLEGTEEEICNFLKSNPEIMSINENISFTDGWSGP